MKTRLSELLKKTEKQSMVWRYAAWTAPFAALSLVAVSYIIGNEALKDIIITGIIVTFFTTSVFWWWWAIDKIYALIQAFDRTDQSFDKVVTELQKIRDDIKNPDQ